MIFPYAHHDFWIGVRGSIRLLLPCERQDHAGIFAARFRQVVGPVACAHLDSRPFPPEIHACRGLDHVGNVGAAYAGSYLDEIEFSAVMRSQEFSMCNAS